MFRPLLFILMLACHVTTEKRNKFFFQSRSGCARMHALANRPFEKLLIEGRSAYLLRFDYTLKSFHLYPVQNDTVSVTGIPCERLQKGFRCRKTYLEVPDCQVSQEFLSHEAKVLDLFLPEQEKPMPKFQKPQDEKIRLIEQLSGLSPKRILDAHLGNHFFDLFLRIEPFIHSDLNRIELLKVVLSWWIEEETDVKKRKFLKNEYYNLQQRRPSKANPIKMNYALFRQVLDALKSVNKQSAKDF